MKDPQPQILSGLSVKIAGVVLVAVLDDKKKTALIEVRGESLNGSKAAIDEARRLLIARVKRARPDLKIKGV